LCKRRVARRNGGGWLASSDVETFLGEDPDALLWQAGYMRSQGGEGARFLVGAPVPPREGKGSQHATRGRNLGIEVSE
jgi:hypothetical protein